MMAAACLFVSMQGWPPTESATLYVYASGPAAPTHNCAQTCLNWPSTTYLLKVAGVVRLGWGCPPLLAGAPLSACVPLPSLSGP